MVNKTLLLLFFLSLTGQSNELGTDRAVRDFNTNVQRANGVVRDSCTALAPGESLVMSERANQSPTGIQRNYQLTRDQANPNRYIASVNINFFPVSEALLERTPLRERQFVPPSDLNPLIPQQRNTDVLFDELRAATIARTRECFQQSRGRITSPDGTILDFELLNPSNRGSVRSTPVSIMPTTHRSNSAQWANQISCGVIIHEVLHLMGLCDGYQETDRIASQALSTNSHVNQDSGELLYNCRHLAPTTNIMHQALINDPSSSSLMEVLVCSGNNNIVDPVTQRCTNGQNEVTQATTTLLNVIRESDPQRFQRVFLPLREISGHPLANAQMRLITMPNCRSLNEMYITCSRNAYRTRSRNGCLSVPEACRNGDYLN